MTPTEAEIPFLPANLRRVPEDRRGWLRWRSAVLAHRTLVHRRCETDREFQAVQYEMAARDPEYWRVMFGVLYEPRVTIDLMLDENGDEVSFVKPQGWYPWVPFHFQVQLGRWFTDVTTRTMDTLGRGDGIVEKSREMGASWEMCKAASHDWLFGENMTIGLLSRKEDMVDAPEDSRSLFFKIRALAGIYEKVPDTSYAPGTIWDGVPVRMPVWMRAVGFEPRHHDFRGKLLHPTKSNSILGESTSSKSGIGARFSWGGIDEGSKIEGLGDIYGGMGATTPHRLIVSSADLRYGPDFYNLARAGERAANHPELPGPSYFRIPWDVHPLRNEDWLASEKARSTDPHDFAREYEINYHAGFGDWVYPFAQQMTSKNAPHSAALGQVTVAIDPGIRDPTSIGIFQDDPGERRFRLTDAITLETPSAEYLAPILVGMPELHECWMQGGYDGQAFEIASFFRGLRERGTVPRFVGDPYGDNAGGAGNESFYMALYRASADLLTSIGVDPDTYRVVVHTKYDEGARHHPNRKGMTAKLLPLLDINDVPGSRYILAALQEYRYKPLDDGKSAISEPTKPMHNWASHPSTMVEFFAVHAMMTTSYGTAPRTTKVRAGKGTQQMRPTRTPLSAFTRIPA